MKIKKVLFLLTSVMSLGIAACGSSTGSSDTPNTSKQDDSSSAIALTSSTDTVSSGEDQSSAVSSSQQTSSSSKQASSMSSASSIASSQSSSSAQKSESSAQSSSSEQSSSTYRPSDTPIEVTVNLASYTDNTKIYSLPFTYSESLFAQEPNCFSADIATFAYGNAIANQTGYLINKFYTDAGFDHIFLSETYNTTPTNTSIAYAFAHKAMNQKDFVAVSIRGFNYGQEWADNFNLGLEGEHNGFAARADEVNNALKTYMANNGYQKNTSALLINGYSRGGAVANLLAKRANDEEAVASKDNIFAYTFEAPQGALERGSYDNIFNVLSQGDLITHVAPTAYGFTRYGIDVDIYDANIDTLVKRFDETREFPPFSSDLPEECADDTQVPDFFIDRIVAYDAYDESDPTSPKNARTREEFANNYQETVQYGLNLYFSLKSSTVSSIKEGISAFEGWAIFGLLQEDGLYNFLKPYIDADGVEYNPADLQAHCNNAVRFLTGPAISFLAIALNEDVLSRTIQQHTPEINYVLLKNYQTAE